MAEPRNSRFRVVQRNVFRGNWSARPFGRTSLALPASFTIEADAPPERAFGVTIDVEVTEQGRPEVRRVEIVAEPSASIETRDLRAIPLQRLVRNALPMVAMHIRQRSEGQMVVEPVGPDDSDEIERAIAEAFEPRPRAGGRQRVTPERLREIAETYRGALAAQRPPTQAVADALGVTRVHAGRLVQRAREEMDPATGKHYLGKTRPGKSGEVEE